MILLADGRLLAAVRLYDKWVRTSLCWIDPLVGQLAGGLGHPSGGCTRCNSKPVIHENDAAGAGEGRGLDEAFGQNRKAI